MRTSEAEHRPALNLTRLADLICRRTKAVVVAIFGDVEARPLAFSNRSAGLALLTISAAIAAWIAAFGGFVVFGDAQEFFKNAIAITHLEPGNYKFTSGYPILIALSGFTRTGSVMAVVVIQAIFSALIPWL